MKDDNKTLRWDVHLAVVSPDFPILIDDQGSTSKRGICLILLTLLIFIFLCSIVKSLEDT